MKLFASPPYAPLSDNNYKRTSSSVISLVSCSHASLLSGTGPDNITTVNSPRTHFQIKRSVQFLPPFLPIGQVQVARLFFLRVRSLEPEEVFTSRPMLPPHHSSIDSSLVTVHLDSAKHFRVLFTVHHVVHMLRHFVQIMAISHLGISCPRGYPSHHIELPEDYGRVDMLPTPTRCLLIQRCTRDTKNAMGCLPSCPADSRDIS